MFKKILTLLFLAGLSACESTTDLSAYGVAAKIDLPKGVVAEKADIGRGVVLSNQEDIALKIVPQGINIKSYKQQIAQNSLNKLKKIHQESPTLFVYESELAGQTEFHFVANQKVGNAVYLCRENVVARRFSKAEIEKMYALCKTLLPK
jgi:hypothetical protein